MSSTLVYYLLVSISVSQSVLWCDHSCAGNIACFARRSMHWWKRSKGRAPLLASVLALEISGWNANTGGTKRFKVQPAILVLPSSGPRWQRSLSSSPFRPSTSNSWQSLCQRSQGGLAAHGTTIWLWLLSVFWLWFMMI